MRRTGFVILVLTLAACGGSEPPATPGDLPVHSVAISGDTAVVMEGQGALEATVRDASGAITERPVVWASLTPGVATVDAGYGIVYGLSLGVAKITATSEEQAGTFEEPADTFEVRVIPKVIISPRLPSLFAGDTTRLSVALVTARGNPAGAAAVNWSAAPGAAVDGNGIVRGLAPGLRRITAVAAGGTGTVDVGVIRLPGRVTRKVAWVDFEYTGETYYRGGVWVADPDGGNAVRVSPPEAHILGYAWSRNGDRLAIATQSLSGTDSRVHIVSPSGELLAVVPDVHGWAPDWSPDGSTIALSDGSAIVLMSTNGGATRRIPMGLNGYVGGPRWSPDGRTISVTSDACQKVAIVDSDGTHLRNLDIPHPTCTALISPDGKFFAYTVYTSGPEGVPGEMGVLLAPTWGGTVTPASPNCVNGPPCGFMFHQVMEWLSDGYSIAERSVDYKWYDRRTGTTTTLGQPDGGPFVWGWSPDGTQVIGYAAPGAPTDLKSRLIVWDANFTSGQYITPADRDANWASWQPAP